MQKTMQSSCQLCSRSDALTVAVVAGRTAFDNDVDKGDFECLKINKYI
mgnify:CR=1 FL=1